MLVMRTGIGKRKEWGCRNETNLFGGLEEGVHGYRHEQVLEDSCSGDLLGFFLAPALHQSLSLDDSETCGESPSTLMMRAACHLLHVNSGPDSGPMPFSPPGHCLVRVLP